MASAFYSEEAAFIRVSDMLQATEGLCTVTNYDPSTKSRKKPKGEEVAVKDDIHVYSSVTYSPEEVSAIVDAMRPLFAYLQDRLIIRDYGYNEINICLSQLPQPGEYKLTVEAPQSFKWFYFFSPSRYLVDLERTYFYRLRKLGHGWFAGYHG